MFRDKLRNAEYMHSFDDVYIVPGKAPIEPHQVDLRSSFSKNVALLIPVASAPMDTVSCAELAIALALRGGIGVLHRNCSIEEQLEMARKVKSSPPIPLRDLYLMIDDTCSKALDIMRGEGVRELPVLNYHGKVEGYVLLSELVEVATSHPHEPVSKLLRARSSATTSSINEASKEILAGTRDAIAVTLGDGTYVGTLTIREVLEEIAPNIDEEGRLRVGAAISPFDRDRCLKLDKVVDVLVSDIAHFHNVNAMSASRELVKELSHDFVAGNIGTYEAARDVVSYIDRVDGLRVGLGGGSICVTPEVGGAYAPTLWAVASVRDALEELGARDIPVIADGGIRTPGDAVKALAAGASSVMLGYVLAGTEEACAPTISIGGRLYKPYRGMASRGAMMKRFALDRYSRVVKRVPEGVEGLVPYKGPLAIVLKEFVEGLKAGLGYAGARNIEELWRNARFGRTLKKAIPRGLKIEL